jgi:flagellar basal body-associated protein FliL
MKFCPQCGTSLVEGDAFCLQCGFKIEQETPLSPVVRPNVPPQDDTFIPPPQPANYQTQPSVAASYHPPPVNINESGPKKKSKIVQILIIIGAIIILGGGGWLVYANFFKAKTDVVISDTAKVMTPKTATAIPDSNQNVVEQQSTQVPITAATNVAKQETPSQPSKVTATNTNPTAPKVVTKTISKTTIPASAPSKVTETVKETKPVSSNQPESNVQPSASVKVEPPSITIFQVGQLGLAILKNPMKDCVFTLNDKYCITRITTDHYNSGHGTSRLGTIGIEDSNGRLLKQWNARGRSGASGVVNCKWVVEPDFILEAGTYKINDSDRETWSKKITGVGFVLIEGYKVQ